MKIGFICAMEEECEALTPLIISQENLESSPFLVKEVSLINPDNKAIIIISGIGKAFAASATTVLIEKYDVDLIINIGSSGGTNGVNIGDIVLANSALYYDVDVSAFNYKKGQVPKLDLILKNKDSEIDFDALVSYLKASYSVAEGIVATGDSFVSDKAKVEEIKTLDPNIKAIEMEGAAIAQVASIYHKDFILIKKVSDLADKDAAESFKAEVYDDSATFSDTSDLIKDLLDYLGR